jgi:hypothetical protein
MYLPVERCHHVSMSHNGLEKAMEKKTRRRTRAAYMKVLFMGRQVLFRDLEIMSFKA